MKKKILLTGSTGFVGTNLLPKIEKKYQVRQVSRKNTSSKGVKGDLLDYDFVKRACKNIDIIIHLAYSKDYAENIPIARNIIEGARANKVKKIILLSSMSAKRSHPDDYGKNKREIEMLIKESGLNYTILRPSIIYGKGSTSFNFMINYIKKIPLFTPIIGSGRYRLSPVHINDVTDAITRCIENKKTDRKAYDLPGKDSIYFIDLVNTLKKEINVRKINIHLPIFLCRILAVFAPKILSSENIKNLTEDSLADINNARKDFKYNPLKFSEGVKNGII